MSKELFEQLQEELNDINSQCENGDLSLLDGLLKMRSFKTEAENILQSVKNFEDENLHEISTEAESYNGKYCGFEIKSVNGRKMYSFKGIEEISKAEEIKKQTEQKYISAFDGYQKGVVQTTEEEGVLYWIDTDGELKPFPEVNFGKSYLTVKESKK